MRHSKDEVTRAGGPGRPSAGGTRTDISKRRRETARSSAVWSRGGSYIIILSLARDVTVRIGALGSHRLKKGKYGYIGSARNGIGARVDRHRRCARRKNGPLRWHIDYLLHHKRISCVGAFAFPGVDECDLSRIVAGREDVRVPVNGFGSSDCASGCPAHLYFLPDGDLPAFTPSIARIEI
jgi:sugar fermentation stimulation protein A